MLSISWETVRTSPPCRYMDTRSVIHKALGLQSKNVFSGPFWHRAALYLWPSPRERHGRCGGEENQSRSANVTTLYTTWQVKCFQFILFFLSDFSWKELSNWEWSKSTLAIFTKTPDFELPRWVAGVLCVLLQNSSWIKYYSEVILAKSSTWTGNPILVRSLLLRIFRISWRWLAEELR